MLHFLRQKWRALHLNTDVIKLSDNLRFYKKKFKFEDISKAVPNLIIIGSQKCGTSSLHYYLMEHPEIYMSSRFKEPGYFIFDEWAKDYWKLKGFDIKSKKRLKLDYMLSDSFCNQKYFGESSTHYTINDRTQKFNVPYLIKSESPNSKIIYLVRNPFERLRSSYYHMVKYWGYKGTLDSFINDDPGAVETTMYYNQIQPYLEEFKSDVLILEFDDFIKNTQANMDEVYDFLGLQRINHTQFSVFNKTSPNIKSKFSVDSYQFLLPLFEEQKKLLESSINKPLDWNFSNEKWVETFD
ncbi:sulfotransferase [Mangrovimonas sp. ST2L15]|uniref:sulfotransferase family protein n=1 Tax=Mangrovimonas sp. ST2L15 TaxID=1645916 RepID=UPI0006B53618|nr:sulfotransferase [Mangrovimonas sp. ST2L15]